MKPATDTSVDYKELVRRGYDRCAEAYNQARHERPFLELDLLTSVLPKGASVLDIGCGNGLPVTRALSQSFAVTGVDISTEQLRLARQNVPAAELLQGDIMAVSFPPGSFDAVVAFFVVFHLPREEHAELFRRIHGWLRPGGYLLATVTLSNETPYIEDGFFGVSMYWSNFGQEEYERILRDLGFTLLRSTTVGHGYAASCSGPAERHPLLFARRL